MHHQDNLELGPQASIDRYYSSQAPNMDLDMRIHVDIPGTREKLFEMLNIQPGERVIELGCGNGRNLEHYPYNCNLFMVDRNEDLLAHASQKSRGVNYIRSDASELSIKTASLDVGIMTYALSGMPCNNKAFSELIRVVKPGGRIGILDVQQCDYSYVSGVSRLDLACLIEEFSQNLKLIFQQYFVKPKKIALVSEFYPANYQEIKIFEIR